MRAAVAGLLVAMAAAAQQPVRLTLKQAVDLALAPDGHVRVQIAEEMVRQAQARAGQARAALLPNVDSYVSQVNQTRNLAAFGIRFELPIPGVQIPEFVGPFNTFDARANLRQNVFDFSSIRRYQASRVGVDAARGESDSTRDAVAGLVARLYLAGMSSDARVEAARAAVTLAERLLKLAQDRRAAGTGTAVEVTRAEVQLANERQRLLLAEDARRRAHLELLKAIGLRLEADLDLAETLAYGPFEPPTADTALKTAVETRADFRAQRRREESTRLAYSATLWERLPSLAGFADYGSIGSSVNHALPTRSIGLSLQIPVFDGGRRDARRSESLSQLRQEQLRTADLRRQVELEVRLALDSLASAAHQVKVAEEGLALAERELEQAQRRYEAGVTSSLEVTDAQTRLERARENRIAALVNHNLARLDLGQATGTIRTMIP